MIQAEYVGSAPQDRLFLSLRWYWLRSNFIDSQRMARLERTERTPQPASYSTRLDMSATTGAFADWRPRRLVVDAVRAVLGFSEEDAWKEDDTPEAAGGRRKAEGGRRKAEGVRRASRTARYSPSCAGAGFPRTSTPSLRVPGQGSMEALYQPELLTSTSPRTYFFVLK